jgi:hypothetical protein
VDPAVLVWGVVLVLFVAAFAAMMRTPGEGAPRSPSSGPGPGATGAIYDLLNQDKRNAIELIVEDRAAERDQEHADDIPRDEPHRDPDSRRPR